MSISNQSMSSKTTASATTTASFENIKRQTKNLSKEELRLMKKHIDSLIKEPSLAKSLKDPITIKTNNKLSDNKARITGQQKRFEIIV